MRVHNTCMSVEFEENDMSSYNSRRLLNGPAVPPKTSQLLIKVGLVKNNKQAYYFMVIACVVFFAIPVYMIIKGNIDAYNKRPDYNPSKGYRPDQIKQIPQSMRGTLFTNVK